jgi:hypothetical protein
MQRKNAPAVAHYVANVPMDEAIARSGVLVVAIDLTLGDEAPYPASVQDANYGVRWLKSKAAWTTTFYRRSRKNSLRPTGPQGATASSTFCNPSTRQPSGQRRSLQIRIPNAASLHSACARTTGKPRFP